VEIETRLMFWAVSSGRDSAPAGAPAQAEDIRDFSLRRARVLFRVQARPGLELYTQFGQDQIGSKIAADEAGVRLKDFYLGYKASEGLQIAVGQFRIPFLRQNLESAFSQLLVDRAALTALRPAREGSRDVGAMAWGNLHGLQYRLGLFDGSDQEDANPRSSLRGVARLSYNWFTREPGFGFTGTGLGRSHLLQIGAQVDVQHGRLDPKDDATFALLPRDYRARAVDLFYERPFKGGWALTLESAWLDRADDYEDPAAGSRSIEAFYVQSGILLPFRLGASRLQVAARYEDLESERGSARSGQTSRTLGLTCFVGQGQDRKIQADYTTHRERPSSLDNDQFRLSIIAVF
jgi:hypothetical protein